jgi:hypothetical protein
VQPAEPAPDSIHVIRIGEDLRFSYGVRTLSVPLDFRRAEHEGAIAVRRADFERWDDPHAYVRLERRDRARDEPFFQLLPDALCSSARHVQIAAPTKRVAMGVAGALRVSGSPGLCARTTGKKTSAAKPQRLSTKFSGQSD